MQPRAKGISFVIEHIEKPTPYVVYDKDPAPLTTKLKFRLAMKTETDPVVFIGAAMLAGMDQAGDTPDFDQGANGFGKRFGANYATGFTNIMIGGAILPSLLHQDPRYFYQGTGTTRSRLIHIRHGAEVAIARIGRR